MESYSNKIGLIGSFFKKGDHIMAFKGQKSVIRVIASDMNGRSNEKIEKGKLRMPVIFWITIIKSRSMCMIGSPDRLCMFWCLCNSDQHYGLM